MVWLVYLVLWEMLFVGASSMAEPYPIPDQSVHGKTEPVIVKIVEKWLPNEEVRQQLTDVYIQKHNTAYQDLVSTVFMEPKMVVLHWTAGDSMQSAWNTFAPATLVSRQDIKNGGELNVSAHFLVDVDGTIYQLLPLNRIARHCIGLNHIAIGIENVGGVNKKPLTQAQIDANVQLVAWLVQEKQITHVIGHYQLPNFQSHPYFSEKDPTYRTAKIDPGPEFVQAVLQGLQEQGVVVGNID